MSFFGSVMKSLLFLKIHENSWNLFTPSFKCLYLYRVDNKNYTFRIKKFIVILYTLSISRDLFHLSVYMHHVCKLFILYISAYLSCSLYCVIGTVYSMRALCMCCVVVFAVCVPWMCSAWNVCLLRMLYVFCVIGTCCVCYLCCGVLRVPCIACILCQ
jgi:hypothetical protein